MCLLITGVSFKDKVFLFQPVPAPLSFVTFWIQTTFVMMNVELKLAA